MHLFDLILYTTLFISLFFEVFLLITYFEIRDEVKLEKDHVALDLLTYPSVSIIVPSYNEERTVRATIESLLKLDYPKDKITLLLVDDGSTDGTLAVLNEYKNIPYVEVMTKQNEGSKFSALNFALSHVTTELVGCLDADSFVDSQALKKIVPYFADAETMAVTPAVRIHDPKTFFQRIQHVEYMWGVLLRRVLASINGLYVTPGPFSIFRIRVFEDLGGYAFAHHTEDMEMALRMQKNGYKIANSPGAYVYTVGPDKLKSLYKQRVRWSYGFLNNAVDYRDMYFNKKYGAFGLFVLPIATFSIFSTLFAAIQLVWHYLAKIPDVITKYQAVGIGSPSMPHVSFNWFFVNTGTGSLLTMVAVMLSLTILAFALDLTEGKVRLSRGVVFYLTIYIFIVPLWLAKATYATVRRQPITWR